MLELSHAVAGPTVSQILADYGAEVIKLERPDGGDIFRDTPGMGESMFLAVNRGKKSVTINLKSRRGIELFYWLLEKSDVLVENLSPGAAERLGITYAKASKANRGIIYCKIESFGKGPMENVPAYDPVLQAASGIMSTTGFPPDSYARAGVSIVDMAAGMHGAIATLFMLLDRMKTGKGGLIELPLYDASAYYMSYWISRFDLTGKDTVPLGSSHIFGSPYNLFKTRDGFVYVAVVSDEAWLSLCKSLDFDDLLQKQEYSNNKNRVERKQELEEEIGARIGLLDSNFIKARLLNSSVPFSILNSVRSLLEDQHFKSRKLLGHYSFSGKRFRTVVNPAVIRGKRMRTRMNPPELGEHTTEVLRKVLKLSKREIDDLEERGVISTFAHSNI